MPGTAKAAVIVEFGKPLVIKEFPLPRVERGASLVKVRTTTVCGTDVHTWQGQLDGAVCPMIPGHEAAGEVHELGEGLASDASGEPLRTGDRVVWDRTVSCGRCYYCVAKGNSLGCTNRITYGMRLGCSEPPYLNGFFSEYVYLRSGTNLYKIPDDLDDEVISPLACALGTSVAGIEKLPIRTGDSVAIQGAGPVGLYSTCLAREKGASKIVVIDFVQTRLAVAERFGATHLVNASQYSRLEDRVKRVREVSGGHGVDHVVEATGSPHAFSEGIRMLEKSGSYVLIGAAYEGETPVSPSTIIYGQLKVCGSLAHETRHMRGGIEFLQSRQDKYPFKDMISHRFKLAETNKALELMKRREAIKVALTP